MLSWRCALRSFARRAPPPLPRRPPRHGTGLRLERRPRYEHLRLRPRRPARRSRARSQQSSPGDNDHRRQRHVHRLRSCCTSEITSRGLVRPQTPDIQGTDHGRRSRLRPVTISGLELLARRRDRGRRQYRVDNPDGQHVQRRHRLRASLTGSGDPSDPISVTVSGNTGSVQAGDAADHHERVRHGVDERRAEHDSHRQLERRGQRFADQHDHPREPEHRSRSRRRRGPISPRRASTSRSRRTRAPRSRRSPSPPIRAAAPPTRRSRSPEAAATSPDLLPRRLRSPRPIRSRPASSSRPSTRRAAPRRSRSTSISSTTTVQCSTRSPRARPARRCIRTARR